MSVVPQSGGVDGDEIAALLRRWPGMSFFAAPTMGEAPGRRPAVAAADLSRLKTIIHGGAPMYRPGGRPRRLRPPLGPDLRAGRDADDDHCPSKADHADRNHLRWRDRLRSVGVPRTNVEVRVVDEADRNLPAGEAGEVVVRGDVVVAAYWKQPDATAEAVRDGWLHAGDVGSFAATAS